MRVALCGIVIVCLLVLVVPPAWADRLHVMPGGLRTGGASAPGDWSAEECYATLAAAAAAAAPADTILLDRAEHLLITSIEVPAALLNRSLDPDTTSCRIACGAAGTMAVAAAVDSFVAAGFTVTGDGSPSDHPAFRLAAGSLRSAVFADIGFAGLAGSDRLGGGGSCVALAGDGGGAAIRFLRCRFLDNRTAGAGGALHVGDGWDVAIESCDFSGNRSLHGISFFDGRGGAVAVAATGAPSVLRIRDSRFLDNAAQGPGGAIYLDDASLDAQDTEIAGSTSALGLTTTWSAGAGIFMRRTTARPDSVRLDLRRCLLRDNQGLIDADPWSGDGGAVMVKGTSGAYVGVTVQECEFLGNFAAQGAGLYIGRFAVGDVVRCRFRDNVAYLQGGATFKGGALVINRGETATYLYCEFVGNRAGLDRDGGESTELGRGGAFSTRARTRGVFIHCSFLDNTAHGPASLGGAVHKPREGDVLQLDSMRCALYDCAFWAESGGAQVYGDENGFSEVSNCAWREGDFVCAGVTPVAPTVLTATPYLAGDDAHPAPGSPLIDRGTPAAPTVDLDGQPVPLGAGPDIGAYEARWTPSSALPEAPRTRLRAGPNPFNPAVTLAFTLPEAGRVDLVVHDLSGRLVAKLLGDVYLAAGPHTVRWRGRDDAGRGVASGAYLATLRTDRGFARAKLMLLR